MLSLRAVDPDVTLLPQFLPRHDDISVRIASQPEELLASFRLTYQSYVRAGLAWPNSEELRVTPYQLEPKSEVFVALKEDEVIVTVSLIPYSSAGLPMEDIYFADVQRLRGNGCRVAEVSCLADRRQKVERSVPVLLHLFKLLVQTARHQGIEKLLIAVHPRHAAFYQRIIGFEQIAGVRNYATVLDRPAVALSLDLGVPNENSTRAYRGFFADPFPSERVVRALPRCRGFVDRMRDFAMSQQKWESELHLTDQKLDDRHYENAAAVKSPSREAIPA